MDVASNAKKVALVVNTAWNIVNFRLGLIKALIESGYQVVAIAPPDTYVDRIVQTGCKFVPLKRLERKGTNPVRDLQLTHELYRIFKKEAIDIALLYTIKPNIYGSIAANLANIPTICTVTGLGYSFISTGLVSRIAKGLYKRAFRRATRIAFQNRDDLQLFIEQGLAKQEKCILIKGSGINTEHFAPAPKNVETNQFIFLFVGRLLFDKGVRELLQAAKEIKEQQPEVEFWMVGALDEDNPSCISHELLIEYQKEGVVRYFGVSDKVREIMQDADVVVLPSYREGLPRVMLEALSMAKPIITTDTAGCRETVVDGKNGYMVPIKHADALRDAMKKMLQHSKEELQDMGAEGRKMALEEFDEKIIVQHYLDEIRQMMQSPPLLDAAESKNPA
jgi:glycosyltransferase involved in cell wall biosynthesis